MNRQKIIDLVHAEIKFNEESATKYMKKKDFTNASMRIYANERLIKLGNELNKLVWQQ